MIKKQNYETPQVEAVALCTEQRILDVSIKVLMATTPPDPTMDMTEGEEWGAWEQVMYNGQLLEL